ncbi:TetR/AcrR family transcriptional regulator [Microlunatus sp. Gsoil 973]|uniref:TetR/AcrR family transcriptional regulator n=1 Tax=Microlunatus sp. Gsoil 973 TaxID=2672569 RepID=UPI0012B46BC5|nr:TetR/AcrR family transcriptional regulator [Microlunatus sp. Gsoil 973]QGN33253.1 TetR family transcriptional regulator [Microlunatus sp. Gsoil 973]
MTESTEELLSANRRTAGKPQPPSAKGRRTRERIVERAARLMLINGAGRTTLDEVGVAAGVGKSQLYHYFKDKDDLVEAVIEHQTDRILRADGPHLAPLDSWDGWQRWREQIVAHQSRGGCVGGCPLGSLANELSETSEHARAVLAASLERWERVFTSAIDQMRTRGLLTADADPARLATATLATLQGGLLLCKVRRTTEPLATAIDAAIANLRRFSAA